MLEIAFYLIPHAVLGAVIVAAMLTKWVCCKRKARDDFNASYQASSWYEDEYRKIYKGAEVGGAPWRSDQDGYDRQ